MTQDAHAHFELCPDELDHPFVMVPTELIRNPNICPEAKWFISYLLSHAPKWHISIPYIIKSQKISKDRIYKIINKCFESGYLKRETYLEQGRKRFKYIVSREPKFKNILLCPENPDAENPAPEKQDGKVYQSSKEEREDQLKERKETKEKGGSPPDPLPLKEPEEFFSKDDVKMPKKDYSRLLQKYGQDLIDSYVTQLALYAKMKPREFKKYVDHAAVIESWILKNEGKSWTKSTTQSKSGNYNPTSSDKDSSELQFLSPDSLKEMLKKYSNGAPDKKGS